MDAKPTVGKYAALIGSTCAAGKRKAFLFKERYNRSSRFVLDANRGRFKDLLLVIPVEANYLGFFYLNRVKPFLSLLCFETYAIAFFNRVN